MPSAAGDDRLAADAAFAEPLEGCGEVLPVLHASEQRRQPFVGDESRERAEVIAAGVGWIGVEDADELAERPRCGAEITEADLCWPRERVSRSRHSRRMLPISVR